MGNKYTTKLHETTDPQEYCALLNDLLDNETPEVQQTYQTNTKRTSVAQWWKPGLTIQWAEVRIPAALWWGIQFEVHLSLYSHGHMTLLKPNVPKNL
jgi:hypothetical protein